MGENWEIIKEKLVVGIGIEDSIAWEKGKGQ